MAYRSGNHAGFRHRFHVVRVTRYRYTVLRGEMRERLLEIIRQTRSKPDRQIVNGVRSTNHVHMFLSIPPHPARRSVMRRIKGRSSRRIQMEYPDLRKRYRGPRSRARGYFSTTSGNVTDAIILQYLELHTPQKPVGVSL